MNQEILEAIQKSLPTMQMDALKKELEKASMLDSIVNELNDYKNRLKEMADKYSKLLLIEDEMKRKILDAEKTVRDFEIKALKVQIDKHISVADNIKELAMAAFRNPTIYKSFNKMNRNPGGYLEQYSESEQTSVD